MVDCNDKHPSRIAFFNELLEMTFSSGELVSAAYLIFANKQDLPNAMKVDEVIEKYEVPHCLSEFSISFQV
jgi:signal recognition particle receptor subunit beta